MTSDEPPSEGDIIAACAREPEHDIGNARRFLRRAGNDVRHVTHVGWHAYDGRRWQEDESGAVTRRLAHTTAEAIFKEAAHIVPGEEEQDVVDAADIAAEELAAPSDFKGMDRDEVHAHIVNRKKLTERVEAGKKIDEALEGRRAARHRHAKSSCGTSKLNAMLTEAQAYRSAAVGDLNRDLYAFNVENGTLRFFSDGEDPESDPDDPRTRWSVRLDPHRREDLISKLCPIPFGSDTPRPLLWEKFLVRVQPSKPMRDYLQRLVGYSMLGLNTEQMIAFFYGIGRNGKSTFVDTLAKIFADYAVTLSIDSFAGDTRRGGNEATPDLARLPGARLVAASEPEMGVKLKDALIKTLTGGEKIAVRRLHQDFFEVLPQFKIMLSGNHKPRIDDTSDGIWRRVYLVPFEVQIPVDDVDRDLPKKLRLESEGVFAWMVAGALDYLNYGLRPPEQVLAATREYREESDPVGAFIRNACIVTGKEEDESSPGELHVGYSSWASREGAAEFKASSFTRKLPDYTRLSWRSPDGTMRQFWKAKSGTTIYRGIRVRQEFTRAPGQDPGPSPEAYGYDG